MRHWNALAHQAARPPTELGPWMRAAVDGDVAALRAALRDGTSVDDVTPEAADSLWFEGGRTALMAAAGNGHLAAVRVLLAAGATVDAVAANGHTALTEAASAGSLPIVKRLLAAGARLRPRTAKFTPLCEAARGGNLALARWLLGHGAKVDERIWTRSTPLMVAAAEGHTSMVRLLLAHGAGVNLRDQDGNTALHLVCATDLGELERLMQHDEVLLARIEGVVAALVDAGARVDLANAAGKTALDVTADRTHDWLGVTRLLLEAGASPRRGALARACRLNNLLVAAELIDAGADVDERDAERRTPLMHAVDNNYGPLAQLLIDAGADPTPLVRAAKRRRRPVPAVLRGERVAIEVPASGARAAVRALALYQAGDYKAALAAFAWLPRALRERIPAIASNLGYCYQQTRQHALAVRSFEAALELAPRMHHALAAACFSLCELARWPEMRAFAELATAAMPTSDYAWQQLALAHSKLGDHEAAVTAGRRAIALNPANGYATSFLAVGLRALGRPEWVDTLCAGLALEPGLERAFAKLVKDPVFAQHRR